MTATPASPPPGASITAHCAGRRWRLARAANLEELWDAMTEDAAAFEDERIPYWTELWPSSLVLADWLALRRADIAGRPCLDIGCGLGLTALVGQWLGARVLGMDYEEAALGFARRNADINGVAQPLWALMDWRRPGLARHAFARIWGGDVMYEKRFVAPVLRLLAHALAPGGAAWVAEPGRTVYEAFRHALSAEGWTARRVHAAEAASTDGQGRPTVAIWELTRPPRP
ncbi:methyltransferase domain-containing protein [Desulfovibrio sp.]|uniref:class I SAM-dependent methyltransferase n=1 Tax=Desulfovibrio sp. TaxID=885 RepID=UPI0023C5B290|nr:methyltransferase domain-containing protein [Desulfovibrio sp.]MDE7241346.1 50S ribosomal protein L11 methyltransferase [Desulfovibrio sp.]